MLELLADLLGLFGGAYRFLFGKASDPAYAYQWTGRGLWGYLKSIVRNASLRASVIWTAVVVFLGLISLGLASPRLGMLAVLCYVFVFFQFCAVIHAALTGLAAVFREAGRGALRAVA